MNNEQSNAPSDFLKVQAPVVSMQYLQSSDQNNPSSNSPTNAAELR